jgi:hypothetical protein
VYQRDLRIVFSFNDVFDIGLGDGDVGAVVGLAGGIAEAEKRRCER